MPPQKNAGNRGAKKESGVAAKNRRIKNDFLDDLRKEGAGDVHIGRVLTRLGMGRMEVFYVKPVGDKGETRGTTTQATIRGSFRKGGKRSVWIDVGTFVAVGESGLGGSVSAEILAVFSPEEMREIAKEFTVDPRVLAVDATDKTQLMSSKMTLNHEAGYEFDTIAEDGGEDVDIDDI